MIQACAYLLDSALSFSSLSRRWSRLLTLMYWLLSWCIVFHLWSWFWVKLLWSWILA